MTGSTWQYEEAAPQSACTELVRSIERELSEKRFADGYQSDDVPRCKTTGSGDICNTVLHRGVVLIFDYGMSTARILCA